MKNSFIDNSSCLLSAYIYLADYEQLCFSRILITVLVITQKDKITTLYCVISTSNMSEIHHHGLHTAQILIDE